MGDASGKGMAGAIWTNATHHAMEVIAAMGKGIFASAALTDADRQDEMGCTNGCIELNSKGRHRMDGSA
jgi:hypothetical protein